MKNSAVTSVRPLKSADLPAVLAIETEANPSPWRAADFAVFLREEGETPDPMQAGGAAQAWVYADPEVRGFVCAVGAGDEVELHGIAVERIAWGQGIGHALMQTVWDWARREHFKLLHLEVREGNERARAFYLRHGFAEVGRRAKYYQDNGETAILMSLSLDQSPPNFR